MHENRLSQSNGWFTDSEDEDDLQNDDCKNCCTVGHPENDNSFYKYLRESSLHGLKYVGQIYQTLIVR